MIDRSTGIMDSNVYDYENVLGTTFWMTKGERLDFRESFMDHAMVFTGVNLVEGKPNRWKVENSGGSDPAMKDIL